MISAAFLALLAPHDPALHVHGEAAHSPRPRLWFQESRTDPLAKSTTGSGNLTYRHLPLQLPPAMAEHLVHAHGGFAHFGADLGGDGSSYFALKNVGLLRLAPDLGRVEVIGGDERFANVNVHNTSAFVSGGTPYLALPSDEAQQAFLTNLEGSLLRTFPNPYGEGDQPFRVCDLEYVDGLLYAVNGYADNVCFAADPFRTAQGDPTLGVWTDLRFGGTGPDHGRFGTAHGITRVPDTNVFTIADRAQARLETYTPEGRYVGGLALPEGSLPCDVDYHEDLMLVGCLNGPGGSTPAPIYLFRDGNLVSELNVGRDLGLEGFTHIHNAAFHPVIQEDGSTKLYVLVYAWNPGNFAILEPVLP